MLTCCYVARGSLLRTCWSPTPTKRPSASEIVELLYNNPRLVSPCIDLPLASVQIERPEDSLASTTGVPGYYCHMSGTVSPVITTNDLALPHITS